MIEKLRERLKRKKEPLPEVIEVKELLVTDRCEFCGSPQGGYIDKKYEYINIREDHNCGTCGVPEKAM